MAQTMLPCSEETLSALHGLVPGLSEVPAEQKLEKLLQYIQSVAAEPDQANLSLTAPDPAVSEALLEAVQSQARSVRVARRADAGSGRRAASAIGADDQLIGLSRADGRMRRWPCRSSRRWRRTDRFRSASDRVRRPARWRAPFPANRARKGRRCTKRWPPWPTASASSCDASLISNLKFQISNPKRGISCSTFPTEARRAAESDGHPREVFYSGRDHAQYVAAPVTVDGNLTSCPSNAPVRFPNPGRHAARPCDGDEEIRQQCARSIHQRHGQQRDYGARRTSTPPPRSSAASARPARSS